MIASLPMYARPVNKGAHDRLWSLIRQGLQKRGIQSPETLDWSVKYDAVWDRPDLVLGHICNLPYRASFQDKLTLIGASDYGLAGCDPGYYDSVIIVRKGDAGRVKAGFSSARFVCNGIASQSGYGSIYAWAQKRGMTLNFAGETGAHDSSIKALAQGEADIAAIDAQTWRMAQRDLPETNAVEVYAKTDQSPGMTFVTKRGEDPTPYFEAINDALIAQSTADRKTLGLRSIVKLPLDAYDLPVPPNPVAVHV